MQRVLVALAALLLVLVATAAALPRKDPRVFGTPVRDADDVRRAADAWLSQTVAVRGPAKTLRVRRSWLVRVDADETARRAEASRSSLPFRTPTVAPVVRRAPEFENVLGELERLGREPVSARVELVGTKPVVRPARAGKRLDEAALLRAVAGGSTDVRAGFVTVSPTIAEPAARSAAATAELYLRAPVTIDYRGARRGTITPVQLARALTFRAGQRRYAVVVDRARLARLVRPRLGKWIVRARNARFVVRGDVVAVAPSAPGRDVDPHGLALALSRAVHGDRVARLELGPRDPDLTTAEAKALRIRRKVSSFTTEMGVSSSNRIHNVHLMADYIDGTIIRPGQTFSFNDTVGPRTEERGFLEGQMIVGALLLPSIGGGVCQTATTLFNNAFELGLPIEERHNHSLYISHYPLGRDATVSWGGPDLRFRNDMRSGLLIKSSYTDETLTFSFYGMPEGRRVVARASERTNVKPPEMAYAVDPRAPRGSVQVVDGSGRSGFDVTISREVYRADGTLLRKGEFRSRYIPEGPTTIYGPGRKPPAPYYVIPPV